MPGLRDLTDQLTSAVLLADADDLQALARLHEQLSSVPKEIAADATVGADNRGRATDVANSAAKIVEQILLRDVKDAAESLNTVCQQIGELQQLIAGVMPSTPAAPIAAAVTEKAPPASAPAAAPALAEVELRDDDLSLVSDFISEADSHLEAAEAALLSLEEDASNQDLINAIFRSFHTIKGVAGFLNLQQIGKLAHAAENLLDLARQSKLTLVGPRLDVVLESLDMTKGLVRALDTAAKNRTTIPINAALPALLERLKAAVANPAAEVAPAVAAPSTPAPAAAGAGAPTAEAPAASSGSRTASSSDATVKVTTERLDSLINMVGELVISQAMVTQDLAGIAATNPRLARNASQLGKLTRELQDLTMSMRMVPIQGVFQKMSRLVRDLARKSGKQIDLVLTGGETELDRNLVEALADPLVHMVRNSIDHGIENPEDRVRAGKPAAGRVELKAYHQAGSILVEITDDGRGLNKGKILNKARAAGLVREDQELSEQEIFKLIFHPGLSTADKITDISGRGVGMDVVRRNVEALRGRIDIASVEGKGSTFAIRLPLTLAVIDGLIVMVGQERYILPITSIERSLRPKADQLSTVQNRGEMCMVRGDLLPLFRLHRLFKVNPKSQDPCESIVVIVQDNDRRCCVMVDELLGQQQVVIKSLGEATGNVRGVSGGAILGDGTISLILDVPGLIDLAASSAANL